MKRLFSRLRNRRHCGGSRTGSSHIDYLENWVAQHRGVEAYVEPKTTVTEVTIVLVAHDGKWTRRRIDSADNAKKFARRLAIPIYDAGITGYPKRMREYTRQNSDNPEDNTGQSA